MKWCVVILANVDEMHTFDWFACLYYLVLISVSVIYTRTDLEVVRDRATYWTYFSLIYARGSCETRHTEHLNFTHYLWHRLTFGGNYVGLLYLGYYGRYYCYIYMVIIDSFIFKIPEQCDCVASILTWTCRDVYDGFIILFLYLVFCLILIMGIATESTQSTWWTFHRWRQCCQHSHHV